MVPISSNCLSFRIIFSLLTLIKQVSSFIIPPEENKIEVTLNEDMYAVCYKIPFLQLYDDGDTGGVPIVRFLPRREGEIKDEIFVKPAKVKNVIPVIDRVGVLDQGKDCSFTMQCFPS